MVEKSLLLTPMESELTSWKSNEILPENTQGRIIGLLIHAQDGMVLLDHENQSNPQELVALRGK
jgi:hypothetical protein